MRFLIKSLLEIITEQLMYYPCVLVFAANMFIEISPSSILLFLSSVFAAFCFHFAILLKHDKNTEYELLSFFKNYSNYQFTSVDLREIVEHYASYEEIQAHLYQNNLTEVGEALTAKVSDHPRGNRFSGFKSFPRFFSPNIVILQPGADNYTIFQQFQLFHELGHIGKIHKKVNVFGDHILTGLIGVLLLCVVIFPWYIVILLVLPLRLWYGSCYGLSLIFGREGKECEKLADSFAIKELRNHSDFDQMERILKRVNADMARRLEESIDYYKDWFESPVNMQKERAFLSKHFHGERMEYTIQKGISDDAVNYNSMIEQRCFPANYTVAYILCGLQIAGIVLGRNNSWHFWFFLIFPPVISLMICFINLYRLVITHRAVNAVISGENIGNYSLENLPKKGLGQRIKSRLGQSLVSSKENRGFVYHSTREKSKK